MNLKYKCPACGTTDIKVWEKYSALYHQTIGGKDCRTCGAMSRRWIGEGNGRFIWAAGFAGMTVKEAEDYAAKEIEGFFLNNTYKQNS
jgi:hypothetical protein